MKQPAREILTVVRRGEFRPGLSFYGLHEPNSLDATFPQHVWPERTEVGVSKLHGGSWEVIIWDVEFETWPRGDQWFRAVRATLASLIDAGCAVSWIGLEGYFCDPPELFLPTCMSGGVLARMTHDDDFSSSFHPDEPLRALTDAELLTLRRHSHGLADAH